MKKGLTEYFYFNKTERNGLIVFITLITLILFSPGIFKIFDKNEPLDFSEFEATLKEFDSALPSPVKENIPILATELFNFDPNTADASTLLSLGIQEKAVKILINFRNSGGYFKTPEDLKKVYHLKEETYNRLTPYVKINQKGSKENQPEAYEAYENKTITVDSLFEFNPNDVSLEELIRLGIPPKTAKTWQRFLSKGGKFYKKEDINKIYGLSPKIFENIRSYINIPSDIKIDKPINKIAKLPKKKEKIDINQATIEDWQTLKGIGPKRAKQIVNFREKLGGFATIQQIAETYNLPDSIFQKIAPQLKFSPVLRTLNINFAGHQELAKHLYISWKEAKIIENYRTQHGNFNSAEDLTPIKILKPKKVKKIAPYLNFKQNPALKNNIKKNQHTLSTDRK